MILVIGATGFIGVYTVEKLLQSGHRVLATGRSRQIGAELERMGARFLPLDLTSDADFARLPTEGVEGVVLLAGLLPANVPVNSEEEENAQDYVTVNVLGTLRVLEYCRRNHIRHLISTTSYSDVAGAWGKETPIREDEPRSFSFTGDHAAYVISKNAATDFILYYNAQHKMQGSIFRFPPVYGVGPHDSIYVNGKLYRSGIATFIDHARRGDPIELWGNPHIKRDIIYVKDVADAIEKALVSEKAAGLYNMTSGVPLDLEEQARVVVRVFGGEKESPLVYRPELPNHTPSYLFDMTKARQDFGFVPQYVSYEAMMRDYKQEEESGRWEFLRAERVKHESGLQKEETI